MYTSPSVGNAVSNNNLWYGDYRHAHYFLFLESVGGYTSYRMYSCSSIYLWSKVYWFARDFEGRRLSCTCPAFGSACTHISLCLSSSNNIYMYVSELCITKFMPLLLVAYACWYSFLGMHIDWVGLEREADQANVYCNIYNSHIVEGDIGSST